MYILKDSLLPAVPLLIFKQGINGRVLHAGRAACCDFLCQAVSRFVPVCIGFLCHVDFGARQLFLKSADREIIDAGVVCVFSPKLASLAG